jgi:hypothetical protein
MKNEEISTTMYSSVAEVMWDSYDEDYDDNWMVSGSDLFKVLDSSEIEIENEW